LIFLLIPSALFLFIICTLQLKVSLRFIIISFFCYFVHFHILLPPNDVQYKRFFTRRYLYSFVHPLFSFIVPKIIYQENVFLIYFWIYLSFPDSIWRLSITFLNAFLLSLYTLFSFFPLFFFHVEFLSSSLFNWRISIGINIVISSLCPRLNKQKLRAPQVAVQS
jgi:hypothetical protein